MGNEANVAEFLPFEHIDDVRDLGVEMDVLTQQMRTLPESCEGGRKHLVAFFLKKVRNPSPVPPAAIGAVDEYKGLWRGLRACRANDFAWGSGRGQTDACGNAAANQNCGG
jgi:hypothetical protein